MYYYVVCFFVLSRYRVSTAHIFCLFEQFSSAHTTTRNQLLAENRWTCILPPVFDLISLNFFDITRLGGNHTSTRIYIIEIIPKSCRGSRYIVLEIFSAIGYIFAIGKLSATVICEGEKTHSQSVPILQNVSCL